MHRAKGADVNSRSARYGNTPLIVACLKGNHDIVRFLVEKGADINMRNSNEERISKFETRQVRLH